MHQKRFFVKNKKWKVYILKLSNGAYYTGITNDLEKRMKTHKSGKGSRCVRAHLPFEIVHIEPMPNKSTALKREAAIKKLSHTEKEVLVGGK